ncbi:MAG: hypothetical protein JWQ45_1021 [Blastococcus sp.]|nr:hypothetical protein [Blastococcus sp.]
MAQTAVFLRLLARLDARVWEVLHPHLPWLDERISARERFGDAVALNPQPLPPREILRLSTVATARAVAQTAITVQFSGGDAGEVLDRVAEDWCPTPPGGIPWPRHWPHPWPPGEPYPITEEIDRVAQSMQAHAALVFHGFAADIADEGLSAAFSRLADRLEEAAATERQT